MIPFKRAELSFDFLVQKIRAMSRVHFIDGVP